MPPLFNYYKLKHRWSRKKKSFFPRSFLTARNVTKSQRDFAWKTPSVNPFQGKKYNFSRKQKTGLLIIITSLLVTTGIWIYHPFFYIKKVEIKGLQRIKQSELENIVYGAIDYRKLLIFPGQSYFLINTNEMETILKERFPLKFISVKKKFPDIISVQLEEEISTLIYDNGKEYCLVGLEGRVVEMLRKVGENEWKTTTSSSATSIVTSTLHIPPVTSLIAEAGDYPIVYDRHNKEIAINNQVLQKDTVKGIIKWFDLINKKTDIPFGYLLIDNDWGEGTIKTSEGWEMKVRLNQEIDSQFEKLQYLLKTKIQRPNLNYIDLRFKDKVYWQ